MKILFDTHVLLWIALDQKEKFSRKSLALLENADQDFYVSVASIWEIAIKASLQKTDFQIDPRQMVFQMQEAGIHLLPIACEHIFHLAQLPSIHRDPFDRLLLAQAETEKMYLMTADSKLLQYASAWVIAAG
ncbi:MAG: type II toxin-antitoxin system VapC family toxin [Cardiobacteriaceae bacterium]|nr:type II toxin-antitoxin system VapC family toxin [Cardiobacteriaceae bacterium]